MATQNFPLGKQITYAFGMMGWSMMINLINVIIIYLYVPPHNSGLPPLITQAVVFGFLNVIAIIMASGRFVDAVYDPLIAQFSDKSKNPKGRRIPLMRKAIIPSFIFCCLVFHPLKLEESTINIVWLVFTLVGFYVSTTTYVIPYYALLPELSPTSDAKVRLASWQSVGYVFGIGAASNAFNVANVLQRHYQLTRIVSLQYSVFLFAVLAAICLAITAFSIDEKKYTVRAPSAVPLRKALRDTLSNRNFLLFIVADFAYFISITLITSGLLYFVKVLLGLPEELGNRLMITMVLVSFIFYPVVNIAARKVGKKVIVVFSLFLLGAIFLGIYFLGRFPLSAKAQIFSLIAIAAVPLASLNILPNAILAEIIEKDSAASGSNREAIYFAVRYFFVKIAQTVGISLFSMFLIYGKDPENDFGLRLNGILGCCLCLLAGAIFTRFKELSNKE